MILGVDTGAAGGIVGLDPFVGMFAARADGPDGYHEHPERLRDLVAGWWRSTPAGSPGVVAFIERPGGARSAKAVAGMHRSFGEVRAVLRCAGFDVLEVTPNEWRRGLGLPLQGGQTKADALAHVEATLPRLPLIPARCRVPHEGIVDAACLALYGRLFYNRRAVNG